VTATLVRRSRPTPAIVTPNTRPVSPTASTASSSSSSRSSSATPIAWYDEIVLLVGSGNFVATLCKARSDDQPMAQVDVFRLADGKVVEHWDNVEPVPEHDVNSGKF